MVSDLVQLWRNFEGVGVKVRAPRQDKMFFIHGRNGGIPSLCLKMRC